MAPLPYPIGQPGVPWGPAERAEWLSRQTHKRSYEVVVRRIEALAARFQVTPIGALTWPGGPYPLFALRSPGWADDRPTVLVTGGVHGYETSGVHGALRLAEEVPDHLLEAFNLVILPCVSPWAYETINRWNPDAVDPNRSFVPDSPAPECRAVMDFVRSLPRPVEVHFDLHETTDTDETEFRPAKAARDGDHLTPGVIPPGFYLVDRSDRPSPEFQAAIRDAVEQVTPIAEADADGRLIGERVVQRGVILYDAVALGLCSAMTDACWSTTTEVYPDAPGTSPELCERAQVAAVLGGLSYLTRR